MQNVYSWAAVVCICSVIACLTEIVGSDTKFDKTIQFVLGCFVLCAVIKPVGDLAAEINFGDIREYSCYEEQDDMERMRQELIDARVTQLAQTKLSENNIVVSSVQASVSYDEEGQAKSINCTVTVSEQQKIAVPEINRIISENFGTEPKIITFGSG